MNVQENNILIDSRKKNTYSPEINSKYTANYLYQETVETGDSLCGY